MSAALALEGVGYRPPGASRAALDDVTLEVEAGSVLAVVGPSGSGKTTLLRLICGLIDPSAGRILLAGRDATALAPERRPVAMVFQGYALFPHLSVLDNIAFGLTVRRVGRAERRARALAAVSTLRLDGLEDRLPSQLSGGERQRVALARALVRDPRVFCLDEPLSSLDPVLRVQARQALSTLLREEGRCAVYVTHDQSEALTIGDRVAVLREGRLEQLATVPELYAAPASVFVAQFVGSPPMSLLPAKDGVAGPLRPGQPVPDGTLLAVRPEDVRIDADGSPLVVRDVESHGHELLVTLAVDAQDLVMRLPPSHPVLVGQSLVVSVDPERVLAYEPDSGRRIA